MKTMIKHHILVPLALAAGLAVLIAVFSLRSREALEKAEEARLATAAELYASVIRNVMLGGQAPLASRITSSLESVSGLEAADLFRTDGSSAFCDFSTVNFVNSRQNRISFPLTARRTNEPTSAPAFRETVEAAKARTLVLGKEGRIEHWYPLLNFVECRQCHGGSPFVRGVLRLSASTASMRKRETEDLIAVSAWSAALVAATLAGTFLLFRRPAVAASGSVPETEDREKEAPEEPERPDRPADFLESLKFTAEELSASAGKKVRLDLSTNGIFPLLPGSIEDPLVRLVRNAVEHGIETPAERLAAGKPEEGRIGLSFEGSPAAGFKVVLSDDGRGLDFLRLQGRARALKLVSADTTTIPKETLLRLLFVSGLGKSGRSGLAEVYEIARRNRWKLSVATKNGAGTKIVLAVPPV